MKEETNELLEEVIMTGLQEIQDKGFDDTELNKTVMEWVTILNESDKGLVNEAKVMLEKDKAEAELDLEREKTKLTKGRAALEIAKVAIPAVVGAGVTILGLGFCWGIEKEGRITNDSTRQVFKQIPQIFKR